MTEIDLSAARKLSPAKLEALVEMMYLAASADGEFSTEERAHFDQQVYKLGGGSLTPDRVHELLEHAERELASSGRAKRLALVKERLPEPDARKLALALAIQLTASDGIIRTSERELILETAEALEIDRDEAADLVRDLTS